MIITGIDGTCVSGEGFRSVASECFRPYVRRRFANLQFLPITADSHLSANFLYRMSPSDAPLSCSSRDCRYAHGFIPPRSSLIVMPTRSLPLSGLRISCGLLLACPDSTADPASLRLPRSTRCRPELVDRVGGWDCDSEAIGEDLHMYLKCFFALNGNLTTRTVLSPVSSTNVTGGGRDKGLSGIATDMNARYKQALRHMWGCLDKADYAVRKFFKLWRDRKQHPLGLLTSA